MTRVTLRYSAIILSVFLIFLGCKKETSIENGLSGGSASGELVDSLGNCKNPTIFGTYTVDTALNSSTNYVLINVNFTSSGKYKIYSDTVNGMWFLDSGFIVSQGAASIKLKGYGTPILPKTTDFALMFNNTICGFSIPVSGSAGTSTGSSGDYFPTTSGSSWAYAYIPALSGGTSSINVTVASGLISNGSLNYAQFLTSQGYYYYFAKDGAGTYYAYSSTDFDYTSAFDSSSNNYITYPFLKDTASVGTSWSSDAYGPVYVGSTQGLSKAVFTVIAKNASHSVTGGQTYSNVINIKRDIMFQPTGSSAYSLLLSGNSYYAKNYGLIDQIIQTSPNVQYVSATSLPVIK